MKHKEKRIYEEIKDLKIAAEKKELLNRTIKGLDKKEKDFLQEHLGFYKGHIALKRKIHTNWDNELCKNKTIRYEEDVENYAWYDLRIIVNIEKFIESLQNRFLNKKKVNFYKKFYWRTIIGFDTNFIKIIDQNKKELEAIQRERAKNIQKLQEAENTAITKYLNVKDEYEEYKTKERLELQRKLQEEAIKYLYDRGYATINVEEGAIAYDQEENIIIIDTRLYDRNLLYDDLWKKSLNRCNQLYVIYNETIYYFESDKGIRQKKFLKELENMGVGIIQYSKNSRKIELEVVQEAQIRKLAKQDTKKIIFDISRKISKRMIFG